MEKTFKFLKHDNIGAADAEDDSKYLPTCFVETGDLDTLIKIENPQTIVLGRTGSGKTALLKKIAEKQARTIQIDPETLSLSYISNSTILNFLQSLNVNLDIFYKLLWRHVFAVEIIKSYFNINTAKDLNSFHEKIRNYFRTEQEKNALKYLEKWGNTFWQATEYRIKEITIGFENKIKSSVGASLKGFHFSGDIASKLNEEQKAEVVHKATHILSTVQVRQLSDIIDLVDKILDDPQKPFYITIDRLDEDWIENKLRYRLIRALVQTAREFRKVRHAKIIIAVRQDLLERVFRLVRGNGHQEEKYESLYLRLKWSRKRLLEILDNRVAHLVKERYTKQSVGYKALFVSKIDDELISDFIVDRTLMQPRDIIHLCNKCISLANGKSKIAKDIVLAAVGEYSRNRLRYLADEWHSDYPNLIYFTGIMKKMPYHFKVGDLSNTTVENFCLEFLVSDDHPEDILYNMAFQCVEGKLQTEDFKQRLFQVFYRVGVVGLKLESYEKTMWSTVGHRGASPAEITEHTKVDISKAFWRVLGIRKKHKP